MSKLFEKITPAEIDFLDGVPFSKKTNDVYFSRENGLRESEYVYIKGNNLEERFQSCSRQKFIVGEVGFGTGLNFLLTVSEWLKSAPASACLHYIAAERHPLSKNDLMRCLSYWEEVEEQAKILYGIYPMLTPGFHRLNFSVNITLTLYFGEAKDCFKSLSYTNTKYDQNLRDEYVNAWYLDLFAPAKDKNAWSIELFKAMADLSGANTTLATFSSSGYVRRALEECGFLIRKIKGYAYKREMSTALFATSKTLNRKGNTPWHIGNKRVVKPTSAIIIGAGLAGAFVNNALVKRGIKTTIFDAGLASAGSLNKRAILFPNISCYQAPLTEFMLEAFLFAINTYKMLNVATLNGIIKLIDEREYADNNLRKFLEDLPELAKLCTSDEASKIAGVKINSTGLYIPLSGWIDCEQLCQRLLANNVISKNVERINCDDNQWHVDEYSADILILANGFGATRFEQTKNLPLKPIFGQKTLISSTRTSRKINIPICGNSHVLHEIDGTHSLGATYKQNMQSSIDALKDDLENINNLKNMSIDVEWSEEIIANWCGLRATSADYLPLVGAVPRENDFFACYSGFAKNAKRWIDKSLPVYEGLYMCAGFGSRGLTSIPLCAEYLASLINNELPALNTKLQKSIAPARFMYKQIIKSR